MAKNKGKPSNPDRFEINFWTIPALRRPVDLLRVTENGKRNSAEENDGV